MTHLLKNFRLSNRSSIVRLVALAATGTGVYCANNHHEDTRISVLISPQLRDQFSWARQRIEDVCGIEQLSTLPSGHTPLQFSRIGSASLQSSSPDLSAGESGKCRCGCLGRDSIANAAALVAPAVVNLSVGQAYRGIPLEKRASGTIIDSDGTILTCAHILADLHGSRSFSQRKVDVTLQDGRTFEGTVLNADFHSDIALLKISSKTPLPTAKLGSSCRLRPGDWVVAMGCPLSLQNTVTAGIVSCVDRKSSDLGIGGMRREYLQTDCAINGEERGNHLLVKQLLDYEKRSLSFSSNLGNLWMAYKQPLGKGNSGGPLVNLDGEIIGVNIMKMAAADGLGFSVPIDSVSKIIEHFKKNGRVVRPWLGLKMLDLDDMTIARLKERDTSFSNASKGVLVPMVTPGSPADRAGFRSGDVVIQFGGKSVESIKEIIEIMGDGVGKPFEVVVKRANDKLVTLTVVPEEVNPDM